MEPDVFKALSDSTRLSIFGMLADGELCACRLLEAFDITQPTLSYHMAIMTKSGIIKVRKEGSWSHYSINEDKIDEIIEFFNTFKQSSSQ